jgi:DNA-binding transcriptional MerR regulator
MRVGEVAKRTGVSVRTLHHYDEIGLLVPSGRSESKYRLYDEGDLLRLLQIKALQQLGFSLQEIRGLAGTRDQSPQAILDQRIAALDHEIEIQRRMRDRLGRVAAALRNGKQPTAADVIDAIEGMTMFDKYFTPEQQETLRKRAETVGAERIREVGNEWPKLIAEVKQAMESNTPPTDPHVQELAKRWMALVHEFSGGDKAIEGSVAKMASNEPAARERMGFDPALFEYVGKALRS